MDLLKENLEITEMKFREKEMIYSECDVIVPDVKPDILKILQVDATSFIASKEIHDSHITVSGKIKYNILYLPENGENCVKSISSQADFSHVLEEKTIAENSMLDVVSDIERVEFGILNSRKLNIKTAVSLNYTVFENKTVNAATDISGVSAETIYENVSVNKINVFEEYSFTLRDRFEIPPEKSPAAELLKLDIQIFAGEIKAITGKAVIKGNFVICALYNDADGKVNSVEKEIPFTEICEIFDLEEDSECNVEYHLCDVEYELNLDSDKEARVIDFDISAVAEITSSDEKSINILTDCFCPGTHSEMVYDTIEFEDVKSKGGNRYTIKETISPDSKLPQISSVYNVVTRPCITKTGTGKNKIFIEGKTEVYVLYISDNSQIPIYSFKREIPLKITVDAQGVEEDFFVDCNISNDNTYFNLNAAKEVEVKCELSVSFRVWDKKDMRIVADCTLCEKNTESGIVIYFAAPGDTLWEIAKRYSVSVRELAENNEIEDENNLPVGKKLIIPF